MTALKSTISFLLVLVTQNVNLKKIAYDQVDRKGLPSLIFKTIQGSTSVFLSYTTIKYFYVSTIGIVCSLMPLIVCVMAALMLGEQVTVKNYITIALVITAVMLVILGAKGQEKETM